MTSIAPHLLPESPPDSPNCDMLGYPLPPPPFIPATIPKRVREMDDEQLAKTANESHASVMGALRTAIHAAKAAGDALRAMKKRTGHGRWIPWVEEHFHTSYETAVAYMRISAHWGSISQMVAENSGLTIEGALAVLRVANPPQPKILPPPRPKGELLLYKFHERYLINREKLTEEQLEFLLEVTENFHSRYDECLALALSKMEPKE
jgi:hypothetical protein